MRTLVLALLLCPAISPAFAGEVSVMPSRVELAISPGEDHTQLLRIFYGKDGAGDTAPLRFLLTTEDWDQTDEGSVQFFKGDAQQQSARPWIVFTPREQEIVPGEVGEIRLSVIVPEDATPGEYRAALIIQPRTPYQPLQVGEKRLDMRLRLSSVIYVEVPPVEPGLELEDLRIGQGKHGWEVRPTFRNSGQVHLRILDSFELYRIDPDEQSSPALVYAGPREESGVALPGRSRVLSQPIPPFILSPGAYQLVYRADAGRDLPTLEGETFFEIPEDIPPLAVESARAE